MATLVFDIETVGENFDEMDEVTQHVLTTWIEKTAENDEVLEAKLSDLKDGLGFSPYTGKIVALGIFDVEKEKGVVYYDANGGDQREVDEQGVTLKALSEKEMLEHFWQGASKYDTFVSFNGRSFDVPFMLIRSMVHEIRPSKDLMSNRYLSLQRDGKHVDLLDQLSFYGAVWKGKPSLHLACRAFGIKSPKADGIAGDDVARLYTEKKYQDIARYNVGDLHATSALYKQWKKFLA